MGWVKWAVGSSLVVASLVACGSADDTGGIGANGDGGTGGDTSTTNPFGGDAGGVDSGNLNECASSSATPTPIPVNLIFMFDKSGSMGQSSKWTSCAAGLKGFFADPNSKGLNASLQFFGLNPECTSATYQKPAVALSPLPDSKNFATAITATSPGGGTPTLPAIQGAIAYGQQVAVQHPGEKVAIVLVTDGQPNDCSSSVKNVSAAAKAVAATIPTYVIGVGSAVSNLDTIAAAGGTTKAIIVPTNNPQQIVTDFEKALDAIRGDTLACEYKIPPPPNGDTLDFGKVNVVFTPTNKSPVTLPYSQDCSDPNGWKYDDPKAPTKILLCSGLCNTVQSDKSGKIELVFGCKTNGQVN